MDSKRHSVQRNEPRALNPFGKIPRDSVVFDVGEIRVSMDQNNASPAKSKPANVIVCDFGIVRRHEVNADKSHGNG